MVSSTATKKAVMPTFTGKYASIRKNFWKDSQRKFEKNDQWVFVKGKSSYYKTERGYVQALKRKFNEEMKYLDKIESAGTITSATISIWFPSRSAQARANVSYTYIKGGNTHKASVSGGPTGGWGYDKLSAALADALNKSPEFMKILMDARARRKKLPYGVTLNSGKPFFPHWDGGVGVECHMDVLKASGYNVEYIRTGIKDSYTYKVTLKRKRSA